MKVLLVFAHPEGRSLSAALRDVAIDELVASGHQVEVSDLYGMAWKPQVDAADFPGIRRGERLRIASRSGQAYSSETLTHDVRLEQEKLLWADVLILQFPLWWFSMPAILKGWVDRVYSFGFGYGVGEHSDRRWGDRYGDGVLAGRRAMLVVTAGGWEDHYSARGVNGPIDDILFPINHGILHYPGFEVLPPFVLYRADRVDDAAFEAAAGKLRDRMRSLATTSPLPFRRQNGGDYLVPSLKLRADLETPGSSGFSLHLAPAPERRT